MREEDWLGEASLPHYPPPAPLLISLKLPFVPGGGARRHSPRVPASDQPLCGVPVPLPGLAQLGPRAIFNGG